MGAGAVAVQFYIGGVFPPHKHTFPTHKHTFPPHLPPVHTKNPAPKSGVVKQVSVQ